MPRRARWYIGSPVTSSPLNVTRPPLGAIWPVAMRKLVVLPAPLGPSSPTTSPAFTSNDTPLTTSRRPKYLTSPSTSSSAMPRPPAVNAGSYPKPAGEARGRGGGGEVISRLKAVKPTRRDGWALGRESSGDEQPGAGHRRADGRLGSGVRGGPAGRRA